jgi:hypothetical protein
VRAVFHCFIGPWENARLVLDLGGLISIGGVATFKNAATIREVATRCPAGAFMVETDAPYLAPEPHRGKRNQPPSCATPPPFSPPCAMSRSRSSPPTPPNAPPRFSASDPDQIE